MTAQGDDTSEPEVQFTLADESPVLSRGTGGGWGCEQGTIFAPRVLEHDGRFYMFYSGSCNRSGKPAAIGFATSEDGLRWRLFHSREMAVLTRVQVDQAWASYCICQPTFVKRNHEYLVYFTGCTEAANDCQIGAAWGTIVWP